ncbi:MFS transporter [Litorimonas haliclonae]|uniref:MFS transporter n=1 Tax=Litorimonas haliclonae TaxID=2081977 RepID=UPI0039F06231
MTDIASDPVKAVKESKFGFIIKRRFAPLFILLQTATFNDNALKNALIALITFGGIAFLSDLPSAIRVPVAGLIFTGPFLIICAIAGQIADKVDRGILLRWVKRAEIVIMLIAALGFWLVDIRILAVALGLMGAQSGFFSPTKNAVLPQWLTPKELIRGNALLNGFVFVVVLVGQIGGTFLVLNGTMDAIDVSGTKLASIFLLGVAVIGWVASEFCPKAPAPIPDLKINFEPLTATFSAIGKAFKAPAVLRPMLGIAWFYGLSTVFVTTFPDYVASVMNFNASVLIMMLVLSTLSIMVGSIFVMLFGNWSIWGPEAVRLSALGIVGVVIFIGAIVILPSPTFAGEGLGTAEEFLENRHTPLFLSCLVLSSIFNGMFVVPLQAMAQRRADPANRARLMSAGAVLLNLFVNLSTFGLIGLAILRLPPKSPFIMVVVGSAIVAAYAIYRSIKPIEHTTYGS